MDIYPGDTVRAFHPRMLGVIVYGTVVSVGRIYVRVDFGPIHGGKFNVRFRDIVASGKF